jgi:predicted RecB family nuclease
MTASAQADPRAGDGSPDARRRTGRIGGNDVGRCLTRLHHDRFTDTVAVEDPVRERAFRLGLAHEDLVTGILIASTPGVVDLRDIVGSEARIRATAEALDAGAPLLVGAGLASGNGTMIGIADLVIRTPTGYAPIEIKHHKVVGDTGIEAMAASLDDPTGPAMSVRFRSHRRRDLLQVAHYWRLLDELGHATTDGMGAVIGSDDPVACVWVDLTAGDVSILDEHAGWMTSAHEAIVHGASHPDAPLAPPWIRGECRTCPWQPLCVSLLEGVDDPTLLRGIDADLRMTLAADDVTTVSRVAELDPSDDRLPGADVVLQARAMTAGRLLRLDEDGGPIELPRRPIEVDFDIETHGGDIYLAGLLVTEGGSSTYEPIVDWTGTPSGEAALVTRLFARFSGWTSDDVIVYHWTDYEVRMLALAAARHGLSIPGWESVEEWFSANAFDLCAWSRRHLASPNGHSLKVIAPLCGFSWRDEDPGGLQSEIWFELLQAGDTAMRERLLAYNEDDVAAQMAVREWVSLQDAGRGPGSGIPSAQRWPPAAA